MRQQLTTTATAAVIAALTTTAYARESSPVDRIAPLVRTHCWECHAGDDAKGKLRLDEALSSAKLERTIWQRALDQIEAGAMPPETAAQPASGEREAMIAQLQRLLANCDDAAAPPPVTMRRLNRRQYRNTIRDLLGIDHDPTLLLPADEIGYGFDNIGDVLSLSPSLMEHYVRMADDVARRVIVTDPLTLAPEVARLEWDPHRFSGKGTAPFSGHRLMTPLEFTFVAPSDDEYLLQFESMVMNIGDEPLTLVIERQGAEVARLPLAFTTFTWQRVPLRLPAGKNTLKFAQVEPIVQTRGGKYPELVILIERAQVTQPSALRPEHYPAAHRQVMIAAPTASVTAHEAARTIFRPLATRAYRRPVSDEQLARIVAVFDAAQGDGESFERSVQLALQAMLCSPNFLYLAERNRPLSHVDSAQIDDYELASRLSYFLWNSMPDEQLLRLAGESKLRANLDAQIDRLIADPRFDLFAESFATQWLELHKLANFQPDPANKDLKRFDAALRASMIRESVLFFAAVLRENRPLTELIDADFTFVDAKLLALYRSRAGGKGVKIAESSGEFERIDAKPLGRGGILTQAAVLTATSYSTRTSPVLRGTWLLDAVLGTPAPPAPPDVPAFEVAAAGGANPKTLREQYEQHRTNARCAACHRRIDPLGFALENYNPIGMYREVDENKLQVDASATLVTGEEVVGVDGLKELLTNSKKDEFLRAFTSKMLTYALGRGLADAERCVVRDMVERLHDDGDRAVSLLKLIVHSDAFQQP